METERAMVMVMESQKMQIPNLLLCLVRVLFFSILHESGVKGVNDESVRQKLVQKRMPQQKQKVKR